MNRHEALGHYVELKEKVEKLYKERTNKLSALQRHLELGGRMLGGSEVLSLDLGTAEGLLRELREVNHDFITAITELNSYADQAERPKFIIRQQTTG